MYEQMSDKAIEITSGIAGGDFKFPFSNKFLPILGAELLETAEAFWSALWHNYLLNKGYTSTVYWADRFDDAMRFNAVLMSLSKAGWLEVVTVPQRNWSECRLIEEKLLEFVTPDMIEEVRQRNKINKYLPRLGTLDECADNLTKSNGTVGDTGLSRPGFAKACKSQYYYDVEKLREYQDLVTLNVNKGMREVRSQWTELARDSASFDEVSSAIVENLADKPRLFAQGTSYLDSRGRAIKGALSKVANPIGYKDFRALLVIPV